MRRATLGTHDTYNATNPSPRNLTWKQHHARVAAVAGSVAGGGCGAQQYGSGRFQDGNQGLAHTLTEHRRCVDGVLTEHGWCVDEY